MRRRLRLGEREFGPHHPDPALLLNNLAGLYQAQGNYAEAERLVAEWEPNPAECEALPGAVLSEN